MGDSRHTTRGCPGHLLVLPDAEVESSLKSSGTERAPMKASVVGSSYVGTTLAACPADPGHEAVALDRPGIE